MSAVYLELFLDSFFASLLLPLQSEFVLVVMTGFGDYPPVPVLMLALLASGVASAINWALGRFLISKLTVPEVSKDGYEKLALLFQRYFVWLAVFTWFGVLAPMFIFAAGFFQVSFIKTLAILLVGRALYYSYMLELI